MQIAHTHTCIPIYVYTYTNTHIYIYPHWHKSCVCILVCPAIGQWSSDAGHWLACLDKWNKGDKSLSLRVNILAFSTRHNNKGNWNIKNCADEVSKIQLAILCYKTSLQHNILQMIYKCCIMKRWFQTDAQRRV